MAAKKTKKKKAGKKKMNALEFCRVYLKKKRKAPFAEIRDAAKKKGIILYPISYGRAQALEGIVKMKPYGSKKKATKEVAKRGPGRPKGSKNKRGPGRPRKTADLTALDSLVSTIKNLQQERDQAVRVLEKIRALLG